MKPPELLVLFSHHGSSKNGKSSIVLRRSVDTHEEVISRVFISDKLLYSELAEICTEGQKLYDTTDMDLEEIVAYLLL